MSADCGSGLDALGSAPRAELLHVLMLPDFERADRIGSYGGNPATRAFGELLIDCEEDRTPRAVLGGMLREGDHLTRGVSDPEDLPASGIAMGTATATNAQAE